MRSFTVSGRSKQASEQASEQANIHMHVCNEVTLMLGLLKLTPIIRNSEECEDVAIIYINWVTAEYRLSNFVIIILTVVLVLIVK